MALAHNIPEFTLGDRLRKAREYAGLEAEAMAPLMDRKVSAIYAWENDVNVPSLKKLAKWAEVCEVDFAWLTIGYTVGTQGVGSSAWKTPFSPDPESEYALAG